MRYLLLALIAAGCTDTDMASWSAFGKPGTVTCYSGGKIIYEGKATGRIQTVTSSDGWEFEEAETGAFIRVSGDCLIRN